jgi:Ca2+-transporting ATPase
MPSPPANPVADRPWHALGDRDLLGILDVAPERGLSVTQVRQRQYRYGANQLQEQAGRRRWRILLDQFENVMLLMLLGVAAISGLMDWLDGHFPKDAIAILAIVGLNALLGYLQESRAEAALAGLRQLASPTARVLRDGVWLEIPAAHLVPGDIVALEAGNYVPADGRLLEAKDLHVQESALTGEALPVTKQADAILATDTPLGDRVNMAFQGTEIVRGRGTLAIAETGMQTELGRIAHLLQTVQVEDTPLQRRMAQLGNALVLSSLALVTLVVGGGLLYAGSFSPLKILVETSLSTAVAVVPEGLPAVVTVTLAIGTQRMIRRHALIRKLPAVETLGSVTVICTDKTGTLTQNKMSVGEIWTVSGSIQVEGTDYSPTGGFNRDGQAIATPTQSPELAALLTAACLCNDAVLKQEGGTWTVLGDPTEGALLTLAAKAGLSRPTLDEVLRRQQELPFDAERKCMSVAIAIPDRGELLPTTLPQPLREQPYLILTKGSPEAVLQQCEFLLQGDRIEPLADADRRRLQKENEHLAATGKRVLALAARPLAQLLADGDRRQLETHLICLGLVGILDAPRPEVYEAVRKCRKAGIRPVMITGDHPLTAMAIARDLGIAGVEETAMLGPQVESLPQAALENFVRHTNVFARVAPEHKLRIVQAFQATGQFVAMTGDGVNDAPAIKQANIGIAMGMTGTDVSKNASDMVLLDDNFATIVAAIEEGRVVYGNIRRFIKYILGSNIGEMLTIACVPLLGLGGAPLTPLQILWMNLVTDGLPALALAIEPAEPNVMEQHPFDPQESVFARGLGTYIVRTGLVFTLLTLTMVVIAHTLWPLAQWHTMTFTMLCLAQMGHALAARSQTRLVAELNFWSNPALLWAIAVTVLLQFLLVYVPSLSRFFGTVPLSGQQLLVCLGFSALLFAWLEFEKGFIRWRARSAKLAQ